MSDWALPKPPTALRPKRLDPRPEGKQARLRVPERRPERAFRGPSGMGCGASGLSSAASSVLGGTKAIPTPTEDGVGHGRSIILSRAARAVMPEVVRSIRAADGSLELRPGAHFLIGRWRHGAWDPAAGATPPLAIANTQHTYVPSGKRQMLRLSYG